MVFSRSLEKHFTQVPSKMLLDLQGLNSKVLPAPSPWLHPPVFGHGSEGTERAGDAFLAIQMWSVLG